MGLPKRKQSRSRLGHRRSQWKMSFPTLVTCANPACGKLKRPHAVCGYCGYYEGVMVVEVKKEEKRGG